MQNEEFQSAHRELVAIFLFNEAAHADLFEGIGKNPRLTYIYAVYAKDFNDEAASRLSLFPNLEELDLHLPSFSGVGLPPLARLEKLRITEGKADGRLFRALLANPALKELDVEASNLPVQEAVALAGLPNIESVWAENSQSGDVFEWER